MVTRVTWDQIHRLRRAIKHSWYPDKILKQTLLLNKLEMEYKGTIESDIMINSSVSSEGHVAVKIGNNYNFITKTSESQGHGKAWETDVQERVYGIENTNYTQTAKYDIPAEDNKLHSKNVSIKTSGSMNICMSDIGRLLKSDNLDIVCIIYKQNGDVKEAINTVVFDFDDFKDKLIEDLKKCNYTLDEWLRSIDEYVNYVKSLPKEYYPNSKTKPRKEKEHLIKKKPLCEGLKYFVVNPKIDSKQQRVQCSINLNKIDIKKVISEGGLLFGKEYTKTMISSSRIRK
jgi:hypothetical protein